jgi:hypothetical protein
LIDVSLEENLSGMGYVGLGAMTRLVVGEQYV